MGSKRREITALHLIKTYCLPFVTYTREILSPKPQDVKHVED